MSQAPDEGFRVTDRRRRDDREATSTRPPGPSEASRTRGAGERVKPTLESLFMSLAAGALGALGEEAEGPRRPPDLESAAAAIDLLVLLRDKTEGNRTVEETRLLEGLVYDLQIRYVRATRSTG